MDDGWSNQRANAGPGRQPGIGNANMGSAHGHIVNGIKKPGKYYDGGGLMLQATPTGRKGVTKARWFRYQIDKRERVMGLGNARVLSASPRPVPRPVKPASCWRPASIRLPAATPSEWPRVPLNCTPPRSGNASTAWGIAR